ncbi:MAG: hypothetical protein NTV49_06355, partial [Kiritimatiellaeota bacterium]|nr:hypothetical protein [Kiritimatiellota bacterium]
MAGLLAGTLLAEEPTGVVAMAAGVPPEKHGPDVAALEPLPQHSLLAGYLAGRDLPERIIYVVRPPFGRFHGYETFNPGQKIGASQLRVRNLRTGADRILLEDTTGTIRNPSVHYDGQRILFSYRRGGEDYHHLYEIGA